MALLAPVQLFNGCTRLRKLTCRLQLDVKGGRVTTLSLAMHQLMEEEEDPVELSSQSITCFAHDQNSIAQTCSSLAFAAPPLLIDSKCSKTIYYSNIPRICCNNK